MGFYSDQDSRVTIFFGSKNESFIPDRYRSMLSTDLVDTQPFKEIFHTAGLSELVFYHQTHGVQGTVIYQGPVPLFTHESDFLITTVPRIGIAVATADCVPLVIYSTKHRVVGIVHAGWRGTVAGIMQKALDAFLPFVHNDKESVRIGIGPAARVCCYEVSQQFGESLHDAYQPYLVTRGSKIYFDVVGVNKKIIEECGILSGAIIDQNICTMHDMNYCSHRASGGNPERQYTVIALK